MHSYMIHENVTCNSFIC